jgi:proteasome lid subunit RPN8/RPN11
MKIPSEMVNQIVEQARAEAPDEACGYLAGRDGLAELRIPMTNVDHSSEHYSFDPREQFEAVKLARERELDLIAVYHSHPETPARMSQEDIRLANDTTVVYVIYSLATETVKGFRVDREKNVSEVSVEVFASERVGS